MQADSRTYFDDVADSGKDNFFLRRIQPSLEVKFNKTHSVFIMPSFSSALGILDVYWEGNFSKPFKETLNNPADEMKHKAHGTQQPRHINKIDEDVSTAQ